MNRSSTLEFHFLSGFVQSEGFMKRADGQFHVFFVYDNGCADFGSRNHLDVDVFFSQNAEHLSCYTGVAAHADTDARDLGDGSVSQDTFFTEVRCDFFSKTFIALSRSLRLTVKLKSVKPFLAAF